MKASKYDAGTALNIKGGMPFSIPPFFAHKAWLLYYSVRSLASGELGSECMG
jgi:hypothetical protein